MHYPSLYSNPLHRVRVRLQHKPEMPYAFLEGHLGGCETSIVVAVECGFVKIFGRRVRVGMPVGKGVDQGREAAE